MADESSPTKQQRNMAAVSILMMLLGFIALAFGTSGLFQTRELFSWYTLLILGGLFLSIGSLVWFIKLCKVFPRTSAKYDIKAGLAFSTVGFAFSIWHLTLRPTTSENWDRWPQEEGINLLEVRLAPSHRRISHPDSRAT